MSSMEREEGVVVMGRVEIDMRAPFRSVKEAVMLFGERVLAGEIYANKLKEMQTRSSESGQFHSKFGAVTKELEETKQSLERAQEESHLMAYCLKSLREELEQTRRELQQLKSRESQKHPLDPEIEELKFIENARTVEVEAETEEGLEFEKKRSVKFASPPSLARIINSRDIGEAMETPPQKKTIKKKFMLPIIGGMFAKMKKTAESPRAPSH